MLQLFRVFIPASVIGLILSEFTLIYFCYAAGSALFYEFIKTDSSFTIFLLNDSGFLRVGIVGVCIVSGLYFQNLYKEVRVVSMVVLIQQLCMASGAAFLIQSLLTYVHAADLTIQKWTMIYGSALSLVFIPLWRYFYGTVVIRALGGRRVLFLGTSEVVQEIAGYYAMNPEFGMVPIGYVDNAPDPGNLPGGRVLGTVAQLPTLACQLQPDLVVVGMSERRQELPVNDMLQLRFSGVHFEEAPATFEATFGRILTRQLRPSRLIFSTELGPRRRSLLWHSLYSFLIALLITIVFLPVMIVVVILVKVTSRGPVLLRQLRVGLNDSTFTVYKFRSMYVDAEAHTGPVWASKDDPRVTAVGKWLRKLRLDELPQLFNVLRGEMSLVGPRPERPEFVAKLREQIPYYSYRHCVKPGITGWAQINYKYGETVEDAIVKLEYDLYYIKNLALSLDTFIMFHTAKVMLFSDMAQ